MVSVYPPGTSRPETQPTETPDKLKNTMKITRAIMSLDIEDGINLGDIHFQCAFT